MIYGAWICLLSPLAAAGLITLAGGAHLPARRRLPRDPVLLRLLRRRGRDLRRPCSAATPSSAASSRRRGPGSPAATYRSGFEILIDPLAVIMMLIVSGVGALIVALLDRLHGRRPGGAPLLRLHGAVRLLDAPARPGRQPADPARRLGNGRALLLPPDRVLARAPERDRRCEEGVRHERDRRRHDGARALPADPEGGLGRVRRSSAASTARPSRTSSRSACSAARSRSRRSCRCRRGCRTRWRARRRSAPSSTRRRWSPPAST